MDRTVAIGWENGDGWDLRFYDFLNLFAQYVFLNRFTLKIFNSCRIGTCIMLIISDLSSVLHLAMRWVTHKSIKHLEQTVYCCRKPGLWTWDLSSLAFAYFASLLQRNTSSDKQTILSVCSLQLAVNFLFHTYFRTTKKLRSVSKKRK